MTLLELPFKGAVCASSRPAARHPPGPGSAQNVSLGMDGVGGDRGRPWAWVKVALLSTGRRGVEGDQPPPSATAGP